MLSGARSEKRRECRREKGRRTEFKLLLSGVEQERFESCTLLETGERVV